VIRLKCGTRGRRGRQPVCAPSQPPSSFSVPRVRGIPRPATSATVAFNICRPTRKPPDVIVRMLPKPRHRHSRLETFAHKRERKSKCPSAETRAAWRERERKRGTWRQGSNYATCLGRCAAGIKWRMRECRDTIGDVVVKIPTERSKIRRIL